MVGPLCCTFIPNNTAPDGSVTRALEGFRTLSTKMAEVSGINNPLDDWFSNHFGKYKAIVVSLLMSIATFVAILTCCGCCFIPCLRTLVNRLIVTALTREEESLKNQLPLLWVEDRDSDKDSEGGDGN